MGERFLFLDALRVALSATRMDVATTGTSREAVEAAVNAFQPELILLDASQSRVEVGIRTIRLLAEPGRTVAAIAAHEISVEAAQLVNAGAVSVFGLDHGLDELADSIRRSLAGEVVMALDRRYALEQLLREHGHAEQNRWLLFNELTARERAILGLVYEGLSADQIADDECVSISTVRSHIRSILAKLNVNSQLAAVAIARSNDWFSAEAVSRSA